MTVEQLSRLTASDLRAINAVTLIEADGKTVAVIMPYATYLGQAALLGAAREMASDFVVAEPVPLRCLDDYCQEVPPDR